MKFEIFVCLCLLASVVTVDVDNAGNNDRDSRKLFGGYKITPRYCKATRKPTEPLEGPSICMFNHECAQRDGQVVGACMDGFLFGACCQLPSGSTGELLDSDFNTVGTIDNRLSTTYRPQVSSTMVDITSSGLSQIAQTLLGPNILPTAQDNAVVQIAGDHQFFTTTGINHPQVPDTLIVNQQDNDINPTFFKPSTQAPNTKKTTVRMNEYTSRPTNLEVSIANGPLLYSTPKPVFTYKPTYKPNKPIFINKHPSKPADADKYVLVPTITHDWKKNTTQSEFDSVINIMEILNKTTKVPPYGMASSTRKPPSTSYIFSSTPTRRPGSSSTAKPPSTSYVFSTTVPPRRTQPTTTPRTKPTTRKTSKPVYTKRPAQTTKKPIHSSTLAYRPTAHSTYANSPSAFYTTKKPPSTSYVYSPTPTKRPPSVVNTHIAGPGFTVTSSPMPSSSSYPSPAPTLIVLSPIPPDEDDTITTRPVQKLPANYQPIRPSTYPNLRPTAIPNRKPVNSVIVNNHVTQNIYATTERPTPTILITPKPSSSSSSRPTTDYMTAPVEVETSSDDLINFPPVRNPNLNMSNPLLGDEDITTPTFIEDDALNEKMESFVNKIIQGLQEPFEGLKDVVYNRNKTGTTAATTTKKPVKKQGTTTKKPIRATSTTTKKPPRRPVNTVTTRRTTTTTRRPQKTTRRPITTTTTTESFIEENVVSPSEDDEEYRSQCGIRPLVKTGRIVGGKGASFGEFPWQVLVRESTWLGLFTKNKCGGVLISNKYVMTAAHCQPGFLASLVAVFGEFDISGELESKRSISRNVKRVIVHRQYDAGTFENDLALLELESPVMFDGHIVPICLPRDNEDFTGRMATVTGWGRLKYGGGVPSVLQEVQVPIMENHVCQEMFRTAGHSKIILDSFLCAGYANGQKDSCEGDSGGPLVLQRPDGRYQLAGTVSHGIKCAAPYLPGVYMRTTYYKPWITSITGIY